jgi:diketogulonate reductase-like aldo/keto reductase
MSSRVAVPKRKFGWTGVGVPIIGQGTWQIDQGSHKDKMQAVKALQLGLDLGLAHIDTAEMYGNGQAEEIVAEAIAGRRDEVFLVSKVLPSNASYEGTIKACKRSLKRLKTDWLDLYLLHWPSSYPIRETMRAMEKLVDDGLIRFFGVSNFGVADLQEAGQALSKHRIACNQVLYSLDQRGIERQLLPYCTEQQIAIVGYSPFGHGNFPSSNSQQGKVLADIGKRHGNRTPRQVGLNYLVRHPNAFSIPKASNPLHTRENAESAIGWSLSEQDIAAIDRTFPIGDDISLQMI